MRVAKALFRPTRGVYMFFSLLRNTRCTERQNSEATYRKLREGLHGGLRCGSIFALSWKRSSYHPDLPTLVLRDEWDCRKRKTRLGEWSVTLPQSDSGRVDRDTLTILCEGQSSLTSHSGLRRFRALTRTDCSSGRCATSLMPGKVANCDRLLSILHGRAS
jgi:hypothetical protein